MKKTVWAALCLLWLLSLSACRKQAAPNTVLVFLEETPGCSVENNGQQVPVGEDAVFTLTLERGWSLSKTDYSGQIDVGVSGRTVTLTLREVQYPARVRLSLTNRYCTVTYDANGGQPVPGGSPQESKTYDLTYHARPNTALGTDLFVREGQDRKSVV